MSTWRTTRAGRRGLIGRALRSQAW
uniref:Uncharacterized protein n=1 Tax=Arundo donax TaxID=35708 RepID=A0A0A8ZHA1_ARUDO